MIRFAFIGLTAAFFATMGGGCGTLASEPEYYDDYGDQDDGSYYDDGYVEEAPVEPTYDEYGDTTYDAAPEWVDENSVAGVDDFYEPLDAYGEWYDSAEYGRVWTPTDSSFETPYSDGYWAESEAGVVYMSDAPYAWAVYHYGRWVIIGSRWAWIPDTYWAPSWVEWRVVDGYIGWAPLGPSGYVWNTWAHWHFVPHRHFGDRYVRRYYVGHSHVAHYYHRSRPLPRYYRARAGYRYPAGPGRHWRHNHGVRLASPAHRQVVARPAHVPRHRARPVDNRPRPRGDARAAGDRGRGDRGRAGDRRGTPPPRGHQPAGRGRRDSAPAGRGRAPDRSPARTPRGRRGEFQRGRDDGAAERRAVDRRRGEVERSRREQTRRQELQRREQDAQRRRQQTERRQQDAQRRRLQTERRQQDAQRRRQETQRRQQDARRTRQETQQRRQQTQQRRQRTESPRRSNGAQRSDRSRSTRSERSGSTRSERRGRSTERRSAPSRRSAPASRGGGRRGGRR